MGSHDIQHTLLDSRLLYGCSHGRYGRGVELGPCLGGDVREDFGLWDYHSDEMIFQGIAINEYLADNGARGVDLD